VLVTKGAGGESGIRTRPFFQLSCCQGDGENPNKHSHSNTSSSSSYFSNVPWFNRTSVFLELMELMHLFLSPTDAFSNPRISSCRHLVESRVEFCSFPCPLVISRRAELGQTLITVPSLPGLKNRSWLVSCSLIMSATIKRCAAQRLTHCSLGERTVVLTAPAVPPSFAQRIGRHLSSAGSGVKLRISLILLLPP